MTNNNWLFAFIGSIITIIIVMIVCLCFDIDEVVKNLVPSIVTGLVSIFALYFGYKNNQEQQRILEKAQEVQVKTTINKEWVENLRKYLAEIIDYYLAIDSLIWKIQNDNKNKEPKDKVNYAALPEYKAALNKFIKNRILLSLYLNFAEKPDNELYELTSELWKKCLYGEKLYESSDIIDNIQRTSHKIFDDKLKVFQTKHIQL